MKIKQIIFVLATSLITFSAQAKFELKDESPLLGNWNLYAEAAAIHKEKTSVNIQWEFKRNGVLNTKAEDRTGRTGAFGVQLKYKIENGNLVRQIAPGREKYETCHVQKLDGPDMILKCNYQYFFLRKK